MWRSASWTESECSGAGEEVNACERGAERLVRALIVEWPLRVESTFALLPRVLPIGSQGKVRSTSGALLAGQGTCSVTGGLTRVDVPSIVAGIEVRATSRLIDSYVLVVEWGGTKIDAVQYALRNAPDVQKNIAGVVLNKVDMNTIDHYDGYAAGYYYYGREPVRSTG